MTASTNRSRSVGSAVRVGDQTGTHVARMRANNSESVFANHSTSHLVAPKHCRYVFPPPASAHVRALEEQQLPPLLHFRGARPGPCPTVHSEQAARLLALLYVFYGYRVAQILERGTAITWRIMRLQRYREKPNTPCKWGLYYPRSAIDSILLAVLAIWGVQKFPDVSLTLRSRLLSPLTSMSVLTRERADNTSSSRRLSSALLC